MLFYLVLLRALHEFIPKVAGKVYVMRQLFLIFCLILLFSFASLLSSQYFSLVIVAVEISLLECMWAISLN